MNEKIVHFFSLCPKKEASFKELQLFLRETVRMLPQIDGVQNFHIYEAIKNENTYYIYMEFNDIKTYENYNSHPLHEEYVRNVWFKIAGTVKVCDLKEIDTNQFIDEGEYNE